MDASDPASLDSSPSKETDATQIENDERPQAENRLTEIHEPSSNNLNPNQPASPRTNSGDNKERTFKDQVTEISNDGNETHLNIDSSVPGGEASTRPSPVPDRDVLPVDESVVEKLTVGFMQTFLPQAETPNAVLDELMRNQRVLIETLEQENAKFQENKMLSELTELMTEAKKYHSKLVHLRKEMVSLHDKSTKLKKRALKLQSHKMKQNLQKEQQRERDLEQEKHLIAKPATKKPP